MTVSIDKKSDNEFRDIRADIEARVKLIEGVMESAQKKFQEEQDKAAARHRQEMEAYKAALKGYRNMLDLEQSFADHDVLDMPDKVGPKAADVKIPMPSIRVSLPDFFVRQLKERGPLSKDELRQAAKDAGYFTESDGGRATHATLVNITRNQRIMPTSDNKFVAREDPKESFFSN